MQGTLVNSEKGMYGLGILFTRGSASESLNFHFEAKKFGARKAGFSMESAITAQAYKDGLSEFKNNIVAVYAKPYNSQDSLAKTLLGQTV